MNLFAPNFKGYYNDRECPVIESKNVEDVKKKIEELMGIDRIDFETAIIDEYNYWSKHTAFWLFFKSKNSWVRNKIR